MPVKKEFRNKNSGKRIPKIDFKIIVVKKMAPLLRGRWGISCYSLRIFHGGAFVVEEQKMAPLSSNSGSSLRAVGERRAYRLNGETHVKFSQRRPIKWGNTWCGKNNELNARICKIFKIFFKNSLVFFHVLYSLQFFAPTVTYFTKTKEIYTVIQWWKK